MMQGNGSLGTRVLKSHAARGGDGGISCSRMLFQPLTISALEFSCQYLLPSTQGPSSSPTHLGLTTSGPCAGSWDEGRQKGCRLLSTPFSLLIACSGASPRSLLSRGPARARGGLRGGVVKGWRRQILVVLLPLPLREAP